MSEEAAFRAAVAGDPADVLVRLQFADFLDDQGRDADAGLVRVLCRPDPAGGEVDEVVGWFHRTHGWPTADLRDWLGHAVGALDWPPSRHALRDTLAGLTLHGFDAPAAVLAVAWAALDLDPLPEPTGWRPIPSADPPTPSLVRSAVVATGEVTVRAGSAVAFGGCGCLGTAVVGFGIALLLSVFVGDDAAHHASVVTLPAAFIMGVGFLRESWRDGRRA